MLIPTLETKIRAIVSDQYAQLEKVLDARFEAVDARFEAVNVKLEAVNFKIDAVNSKVDSLEKRFPVVQEIAEIKARLNVIEQERKTSH
jgi:hypothetical protein